MYVNIGIYGRIFHAFYSRLLYVVEYFVFLCTLKKTSCNQLKLVIYQF